jgi:hypothetical protein
MKKALPEIVARRAYIDTVRVWFPQPLTGEIQRQLRRLAPNSHYSPAPGGNTFRAKQDGKSVLYLARVTLQGVIPEVGQLLESVSPNGPPPFVNAVHFALDLVTRS